MSAVALFACGVDYSTPQNDTSNSGDPDVTAPSPSGANGDESLGTSTDEVITPDACHVTLNFCDGSGAVGTDCTETGCSVSQAISVCKSIVSSVGCAIHCNAVIRNSSGTIIDTFRQQCGSTCCPQGDFCGAGGRCCNGSCQPGCPC